MRSSAKRAVHVATATLVLACGARTVLPVDEPPDAAVAPPVDAGHDAGRDVVPDVTDAGIDVHFDPCDGCARLLAIDTDANALVQVLVKEGTISDVAPASDLMTDIAFTRDRKTLYASVEGIPLATVNLKTGHLDTIGAINEPGLYDFVGLEVGPDGTLYGAELESVYILDPATGAHPIATFPSGYLASGDLAFVGQRLFATVTRAGDFLVEVDLSTHTTRLIGDTGTRCVLGLAGIEGTLYGVTCTGLLTTIDVGTGRATILRSFTNRAFSGASPW